MPDGTGVDATMQCLFCGEQEHVEVFEVWGHDFMFHTCCEGLHEQIAFDMNDDPAWARRFLQRLGIEELCGHELRRVADDDSCSLVLDWSLRIAPVTHDQARSFIARHHAHCRPPVMWRFHTGIFNGRTLLGVAVVGIPLPVLTTGAGSSRSTGCASGGTSPSRCAGMPPPCFTAGAPGKRLAWAGRKSSLTPVRMRLARRCEPQAGNKKAEFAAGDGMAHDDQGPTRIAGSIRCDGAESFDRGPSARSLLRASRLQWFPTSRS